MSWVAVSAFFIVAFAAGDEPPVAATNADAASEGERDLNKAAPLFKRFVSGQPYGKTWLQLAKTEPAPKDRTGLGQAQTHDKLKNDPMELQAQARYVEATDTTTRFGTVVIRGERIFKYGKLDAVRVVLEMAGKPSRESFVRDIEAIAAAWSDPLASLDLAAGYTLVKNDLVEQKKKKPDVYPQPPLAIEFSPKTRSTP